MAESQLPATPRTLVGLARDHLGLVVTIVPLLLSLLRVFAVAQGDRATLVTLLSTLDVKAILLGTFAWMLPTAVGAVSAVLWISWLQQRSNQRGPDADRPRSSVVPAVLAATTALVLFAVAPVNDLLTLLVCVLAVIFFRDPRRNRLGRPLLLGAGFLLFILAPVVFRSANMWLPAEKVVLDQGQSMVGYVLSLNSLDMTLLDAAGPTVHRVPVEDVATRTVCRLNPNLESASLVNLVTGTRTTTPSC